MIVPMPAASTGFDLVEAVDLDLDVRRVRQLGDRALQGRGDRHALLGEHGQVVVLGHHRVRERVTVIVAAAVANRVPFERAQDRAWSCGCRRYERPVWATSAT